MNDTTSIISMSIDGVSFVLDNKRELLLCLVMIVGVCLCSMGIRGVFHCSVGSICKARTMQTNSFRAIVCSQMVADILKLSITTAFCLIPASLAPAEDAIVSKIVGAICETLYFFACDLHTLFAIHRFILVVFPSAKTYWSCLTPFAVLICFCTGAVKAFYLMALDPNLFLKYDRRLMQWMFTNTPWTNFYKISKIIWSSTENVLIITLDLISFFKLRQMLKKFPNNEKFSGADVKLVAQSLCQCVPTSLVVVFYFYIYPSMTDEFLMFATSTLMWNLATLSDGLIIVLFYTRVPLFKLGSVFGSIGCPISTSPFDAPRTRSAIDSSQQRNIRTIPPPPCFTLSAILPRKCDSSHE